MIANTTRVNSAAADRSIVLTGCTRGLGLALTEYFVAQGARVAGCGLPAASVASVSKLFPAPHRFTAVDVADDEAVQRWADAILAESGPPDLLLNNAAIILPNAPLWQTTAADFSRLIDINVKGVASTIRHFLPAMIVRGRGVVVNFSSGWGRTTSPHVAAYCASKWALEGLTHALAQELPPGLAAVALNPQSTNTQMLQSCLGTEAAQFPTAAEWAQRAGPFLLGLGPEDNGRSLDVPLA